MKRMTAVSLFSGAMGLDLGIEKAGFDIKLCVEMDKRACETIRANTQIPVLEGDVNAISSEDILKAANLKKGQVDLVFGGPPCQAFSTAGKRRSLEDFRGNVIIRFLHIVRELKPKFFILENVRGILSAALSYVPEEYNGDYKGMLDLPGSVIYFLTKEFEKLGYSISFSLFNAANYGVPQKRERVIIFGHRGKRIPLPSPTHSETGMETGNKWVSLRQAFKGLDKKEHNFVQFSAKSQKYLSLIKPGQYWKHLPDDVVEEAMGKSFNLQGGKTGFYRRLSWNDPSPTVVTSPTMPATMLAHPEEDRPLSIQEYARIQMFPDNWKFKGNVRDIYKQIGNAVPVGLGLMAGKTIVDFAEGNYDPNRERMNKVPYSRYRGYTDLEFIPAFERIVQGKNELQKNTINNLKIQKKITAYVYDLQTV